MDRDDQNRTEMFSTVDSVMDTNKSIWGGVPAINETTGEFKVIIADIGESIRKEKRIAFMLENMIFREDGTYDKAALADFRRSQKEIRDLYLMPVSRMNFSNGNTKDDMRGASNYFNLQQPFSQRQSDRARQQQLVRTRNQPTFRLT